MSRGGIGKKLCVNAFVGGLVGDIAVFGVKEELFHALLDGSVCFVGKLCRQNLVFCAVVKIVESILGDVGDL